MQHLPASQLSAEVAAQTVERLGRVEGLELVFGRRNSARSDLMVRREGGGRSSKGIVAIGTTENIDSKAVPAGHVINQVFEGPVRTGRR